MVKNGGEKMARGLLYTFQKSWLKGVLPDAFKLDPKVMLPKPCNRLCDKIISPSYTFPILATTHHDSSR